MELLPLDKLRVDADNRKHLLATLVLLAFASASCVAQSITVLHLESYVGEGLSGNELTVRASVQGKQGLFLFDTGAGVSSFTPEYAATIGCKVWGQITGFRMNGQRLDMQRCDNTVVDLAGQSFPVAIAGVFDPNKFEPQGSKHLDGMLALDAFAGRTLTFSFARRTITLHTASSLKRQVRSASEVPIRLVRDAEGIALTVDVAVPTQAGLAWMEFDSGNTGPYTLVGKHVAEFLQLDPGSTKPQHIEARTADGSAISGDARVMDMIMDGNLGISFLRQHDVTLDLSSKRAWFSPPLRQ